MAQMTWSCDQSSKESGHASKCHHANLPVGDNWNQVTPSFWEKFLGYGMVIPIVIPVKMMERFNQENDNDVKSYRVPYIVVYLQNMLMTHKYKKNFNRKTFMFYSFFFLTPSQMIMLKSLKSWVRYVNLIPSEVHVIL